jgi:GNAT superfamily N-acetyltransferase
MEFHTFESELTEPLVAFWNRTFGALHNAMPVTASLLRRRVLEKVTAVEAFDPTGMILACDGGSVRGLIHVAIQPESVCRALEPSWGGGERGMILLLGVEPQARRRGVGAELWRRGMERLAGAAATLIDGQCLNPFYGNSEGPFTPFWGTPEGIALPWSDAGARAFLANRGHTPRYRAVQVGVDLPGARSDAPDRPIGIRDRACPPLEAAPTDASRFDEAFDFRAALALEAGRVAGTLIFFPMSEVREGLWGVYELRVADACRGRGIGRALLAGALRAMRERGAIRCEATTIPELSPGAPPLYASFGFEPCAEWAVY